VAAQAMAQRLLDAGIPGDGYNGAWTERAQGQHGRALSGSSRSKLRPMLIIGHLDVVEARREDWTTDPFQFVEQDVYFYGRGTQDMKSSDAIVVADFIRMMHEDSYPTAISSWR